MTPHSILICYAVSLLALYSSSPHLDPTGALFLSHFLARYDCALLLNKITPKSLSGGGGQLTYQGFIFLTHMKPDVIREHTLSPGDPGSLGSLLLTGRWCSPHISKWYKWKSVSAFNCWYPEMTHIVFAHRR